MGEHRQALQEIKAMILSEKLESQKVQGLIEKRQQIMKQKFIIEMLSGKLPHDDLDNHARRRTRTWLTCPPTPAHHDG
jgi:hypothetical protein